MEDLISRTEFLKRAAKLGGKVVLTGLTFGCIRSSPELAVTQQSIPEDTSEVRAAKERIEKKFNIEVGTIKEFYERSTKLFGELEFKDFPLDDWDIERLILLERFLEILPDHLYAPAANGNKLRIMLGTESTIGIFSVVQGYPHAIDLDYRRFRPEDPRLCLIDLTHELTHLHTPETSYIEQYTYDGDKKGERLVTKSPWYDEVEGIIGEKFEKFAPEFRKELERKNYIFILDKGYVWNPYAPYPDTPEQEEKDKFANEFGYGMTTKLGEIIAVLAQTYVQGRDYFIRMYGDYLNEGQTLGLYEFTKNRIFKGKEYDEGEVKRLLKMGIT